MTQNAATLALSLTAILYFANCSLAPAEARQDPSPNQNSSIRLPVPSPEESSPVNDCESLSFRCLILYDEQHSNVVRHVDVALAPNVFSEQNLRRLFALISKTHPDAIFLVVIAKTLDSLPSRVKREPGPGSGTSGDPTNVETYEQYIAQYYRRDGNEFFMYTPELRNGVFRNVIVKGRKMYRNGVWREPSFWNEKAVTPK